MRNALARITAALQAERERVAALMREDEVTYIDEGVIIGLDRAQRIVNEVLAPADPDPIGETS